jgi:Na+(H+)/acetate symporter ActP
MLFLALGHLGAFFQLNGQFKWDWFKNNEWVIAACGMVLSFFYIWGTKYAVEGMGGLLWPVRFIGFGIGVIIYAIMVSYFFNEGITTKTWISLALAVVLICIQVFWK